MIFDTISVTSHWEWWCRWKCDLRVIIYINKYKKRETFSVVSNGSPRRIETCTSVYFVTLRSAVTTKWPAWVKKTKKRGPERPAYSCICINPSGRILLNDEHNILPAAEMPELTIRTGNCSHHTLPFVSVLFFDPKCTMVVVVVFLLLPLHQALWH